jgi:glycine hydroxymethyltransferase
MHVIAGKAVAFYEAMQPAFHNYQAQVLANARALAEGLSERGLRLVSGGTDNHLMLVDVKASGITGKAAQERLSAVGITVNKNAIPFDREKPTVTSGVRLGTPQVTTRGLTEADMSELADIIAGVIKADSGFDLTAYQERVAKLTEMHPLPGLGR